jgi:hypothetical protein
MLLYGGSFDVTRNASEQFTLYLRGIDDAGLTLEIVRARITEAGAKSYRDIVDVNTRFPQTAFSPQRLRALALNTLRLEDPAKLLDKAERREFRLPRPPVTWRFRAASMPVRDPDVTVRFTNVGSSVTAAIVPESAPK